MIRLITATSVDRRRLLSTSVATVATVLGLATLALAQPWEVCFALLLPGVISVAVPLGLLRTIRRRFAELELRRMRAFDVG